MMNEGNNGKWTKMQWEIRNNGRIKMNERNNEKMDENVMGDQEQWKDQDEQKKQWDHE